MSEFSTYSYMKRWQKLIQTTDKWKYFMGSNGLASATATARQIWHG